MNIEEIKSILRVKVDKATAFGDYNVFHHFRNRLVVEHVRSNLDTIPIYMFNGFLFYSIDKELSLRRDVRGDGAYTYILHKEGEVLTDTFVTDDGGFAEYGEDSAYYNHYYPM